MKAAPAKKGVPAIRRRHQSLFTELDAYLSAYLNSLKRAEATVPVRSDKHWN